MNNYREGVTLQQRIQQLISWVRVSDASARLKDHAMSARQAMLRKVVRLKSDQPYWWLRLCTCRCWTYEHQQAVLNTKPHYLALPMDTNTEALAPSKLGGLLDMSFFRKCTGYWSLLVANVFCGSRLSAFVSPPCHVFVSPSTYSVFPFSGLHTNFKSSIFNWWCSWQPLVPKCWLVM